MTLSYNIGKKPAQNMKIVLGPTNTGKTFTAIQHMVTFKTGVIGFPLRLLARENYDRLVAEKGRHAVALITGEEKIIPRQARYFCCTVESMPVDRRFDFLAVDEIQLCTDPERGHVFTDRLLRARGTQQTMFMGAETMRSLLSALFPQAEINTRPRLSSLTYTGFKKLTRLPQRSAVVAFNIDDLYATAEMIRRQRGGTAVVLGALSPRTRNKQVGMYQAGEVDFLVATDAIGMGLNMDIHHVALAARRKFDGKRARDLSAAEIAQVAGRAGRYKRDGTFGVTGHLQSLDEETIDAVQAHRYPAVSHLCWRNSVLEFANIKALKVSLEMPPPDPRFVKGRPADDALTLHALSRRADVIKRASSQAGVRMLWDVCQVPDFRRTLSDQHQDFIEALFLMIADRGRIEGAFVAENMTRLNVMEGDVDTLMSRLSHIRTWTYITHKSEWLDDAQGWQAQARDIEDRLSDALHERLMSRFVDRRTSVLAKAVAGGDELLAGIRTDGTVIVEGEPVGVLNGLRFRPEENVTGEERRLVLAAARQALTPTIRKRIADMINADHSQFTLQPDGTIAYQEKPNNPVPGAPVARVGKGKELLAPELSLLDSDLVNSQDKSALTAHLENWLKQHIGTVLSPLFALMEEGGESIQESAPETLKEETQEKPEEKPKIKEKLEGAARGIAYQLYEALGIRPRAEMEDLIAGLDEAGRRALRQRRVRMGPIQVFLPELNKPAAVRLRALLWSLYHDKPLPAQVPHDGATSVPVNAQDIDHTYYRAIGYPVYGVRAIRIDMLDRVVCEIYDKAIEGRFRADHKMAEWLGCGIDDLYKVIEAMGHKIVAGSVPEPKEESEAGEKPEEKPEERPEDEKSQEKPQLAEFYLKRGKAYGKKQRPPRRQEEGGKPSQGNRERQKGKPREKSKGDRKKDKPRTPSVISAKAKDEDISASPFAVLEQLKKQQKK